MQLDDYLNLPYTITLRRDDEGDWVARVDELKGCTAHGETDVEALAQLAEAKRDWIQAALEDRISIPLPAVEEELPSGKWVQRVPRSLHRDLRHLAKADGVSFNQFVGMILSAYVGSRLETWATRSPLCQAPPNFPPTVTSRDSTSAVGRCVALRS
jgi:antitoxin HicB